MVQTVQWGVCVNPPPIKIGINNYLSYTLHPPILFARPTVTEGNRFRRYKLQEEAVAGGGALPKNKKKKPKSDDDWE